MMMKCWVRWIIFLHLSLISLTWADLAHPLSEKILNFIEENFSTYGVLKQNQDGFVYVDIDDDYIHKLIRLIEKEGFQEPPYFKKIGAVGAHISVIYQSESEYYHVGKIKECGNTVHFKPQSCLIVRKEQGLLYYLVMVEAPVLEDIRKQYGLSPSKYGFHVTIGSKKDSALE